MTLLPNKQLLLKVPVQSTKYEEKEIYVHNELEKTIGENWRH